MEGLAKISFGEFMNVLHGLALSRKSESGAKYGVRTW